MRISDWSSDVCSSDLIAADVVDEAQVKAMVSAAVKAFGRLDGTFNNAGIANRPAEIGALELADWTRPMSIDLLGAWLCMKYDLEVMLRQGGGAIVNTASNRSEEHTSELQSLMRISYAVFCFNNNNLYTNTYTI